jgi:hypothetical protein
MEFNLPVQAQEPSKEFGILFNREEIVPSKMFALKRFFASCACVRGRLFLNLEQEACTPLCCWFHATVLVLVPDMVRVNGT